MMNIKTYSNSKYVNNLINYDFKIGEVIKIIYLVRLRNKKRVYTALGLCYFKNNKHFYIFNRLKKENLQLLFQKFSPAILKIFILKMYKYFVFRISKIYFKKNLFLKENFYFLDVIKSSINSYTFIFLNFFISLKMGKKQKKKIIFKYRFRTDIHSKLKERTELVAKEKKLNYYANLIQEYELLRKMPYISKINNLLMKKIDSNANDFEKINKKNSNTIYSINIENLFLINFKYLFIKNKKLFQLKKNKKNNDFSNIHN
jgi:hypothetical protein